MNAIIPPDIERLKQVAQLSAAKHGRDGWIDLPAGDFLEILEMLDDVIDEMADIEDQLAKEQTAHEATLEELRDLKCGIAGIVEKMEGK